MKRPYLIPVEANMGGHWVKYFPWKFDPDPPALVSPIRTAVQYYGFAPTCLVVTDLIEIEHNLLAAQPDVFVFPTDFDLPITDPNIDTFFEGVNIPTDWLTPSTTYRELLRSLCYMCLFNEKYGGIAIEQTGQIHDIWDNATLDTRLREMTAQEEEWFYLTVESFGYPRSIVNRNAFLRQLVKQAGDLFMATPFTLDGLEF